MKTKTLAILVASVLFAFSFTFSSCKDCGKRKGRREARSEEAKPTDLTTMTDGIANPGNAPDVRNPENSPNVKNPESEDPIIKREKEIREEAVYLLY